MNLRTMISTAALALLAAGAHAQAPAAGAASTPRVDQRQERQDTRIEKGVASGTLTPREARRLERQQKGVAQVEANAKADGNVTPQERKRLHKMQDATSRNIKRQKHDAQGAASGPGN